MMDIRRYDDVSYGFEIMRQHNFGWNSKLLVEQPKKHQKPRTPRVEDVASDIYTRLPRELRNRVYAFCVQGSYDNEVIVRRTAIGNGRRFAHLIRQACGQHSYQWIEDPTAAYMSAGSLGSEVARELLECYYWTRTFKFAHHELFLLKAFLETDGFGLGMIPAHYARRLHIQVRPLDFAFLLPEKRLFEERRYCNIIEGLAIIKTARTEVVIEVDLAQGSLGDADYERFSNEAAQFMLKIGSVVETLRRTGLRINLAIM
ncbi:hypothetical protein BKA58DRAFT_377881 [Alternaria rosae]|uniref:uncharacterized protein n=1 Tax=Alternaria rosae TaxID=1187941 RepID=UPI001E8CFE82|nr:uncharacterized protein BKA58DRAFT_377881 [Alternaria rosae]KAH6878720.1 hypothetical protein BKA58DRAFT_377881 [Alternaria rosae]